MLVLADASAAREQLVTDLVVLGYRPLLHPEGVPSPSQPGPGMALILSDDVRNHAIPRSEALRRTEAGRSIPLLWLVEESDLGYLSGNEHLLDEFLTVPYPTAELGARLALMHHRSAGGSDDVVKARTARPERAQLPGATGRSRARPHVHGVRAPQAVDGVPGRVYTREEILSLVWGYDYFGGMRTVDVHVRRVRAKLGQDHAWLIETVRGVGYRLAEVRA